MGEIPAANRMVSTVFKNPKNAQVLPSGQAIDFTVQIANLQAGTFTNPDVTYYSAPQTLQGGQIVGHTHITVQDLNGNADTEQPLDAETFAFFKGINDAGNGNGELTASLAAGLPDGVYRACSMTSASNHQPVIMPVAQRGPQDDCVRFTVGGNGQNNGQNGGNQGQNNGQNGQGQQGQGQQGQGQQGQGQQGQGQQGQGQQGQGQQGQGQQGQGQQGQGGQGQGGFGRGRGRGRGRFNKPKFAARDFIA
jgi:transcription initiation factor TFIID subunit 15